MPVTNVLAVIPAADLSLGRPWWTQLLGREPDRVPMPSDVGWHFCSGAWQLVEDSERAGPAASRSASMTSTRSSALSPSGACRRQTLDHTH